MHREMNSRPSKSPLCRLRLTSFLLPQTIHLRPRQPHIGAPTRPNMPKRQRRRDVPTRLVKRPRCEDEADQIRCQQQPAELLQDQLRGDRWVSQLTAGPEDKGTRGGGLDGDVEEEGEFCWLHRWRQHRVEGCIGDASSKLLSLRYYLGRSL
ncbi:hypothetical protein CFIO01_03502 [Colletotrichum fioriniae PJ7]|uniref:Uncharacterized protein n=1 Tax=Colletotrichum fioriniae PJ7 TaxID=1445577 RepID=A0A010R915_9PEZI|nr:hypothetical protein CFIO01_03502 [Colletotrichum fioriniae PJ7]